jgi:hypothetical protein
MCEDQTSDSLFIPPGEDLDDTSSESRRFFVTLDKGALAERWQTQEGQEILREWVESGFDRERLDQLVGRYDGHSDLRGAAFIGLDLCKSDLRAIDFFSANLFGADLSGCDLRDSWLSESDLRGTRFDWAIMGGSLLDNVQFDQATSFVGVDLNGPSFVMAALLRWQAEDQQRIAHLRKRNPLLARVLWATTDYGRSLTRWVCWCAVVITLFGVLFGRSDSLLSETGLGQGLYFSVITFTTLGYGDITPISTAGQLLVVIEVLLGYAMLGLLVAILSRKVTGR